jgi:hypothetical protein
VLTEIPSLIPQRLETSSSHLQKKLKLKSSRRSFYQKGLDDLVFLHVAGTKFALIMHGDDQVDFMFV